MKQEFFKHFNSERYGQLLVVQSVLKESTPNDMRITIHFAHNGSIHRITQRSPAGGLAGLKKLFEGINQSYVEQLVQTCYFDKLDITPAPRPQLRLVSS